MIRKKGPPYGRSIMKKEAKAFEKTWIKVFDIFDLPIEILNTGRMNNKANYAPSKLMRFIFRRKKMRKELRLAWRIASPDQRADPFALNLHIVSAPECYCSIANFPFWSPDQSHLSFIEPAKRPWSDQDEWIDGL